MESLFYSLIISKNPLVKGLLALFSLGMRFCIAIRVCLYRLGIIKAYKAGVPVLSIGNITLGGSGKTPLVIFAAKYFSQTKKVAILSRGYGRKIKTKDPLVISQDNMFDASQTGDEPLVIARSVPNVQIFIHANRVLSAKKAISMGCELLILDDGYQHWRIQRDEDWVVIGGRYPLGLKKLFPSGTLREPLQALKRATALFLDSSFKSYEMEDSLGYFSDALTLYTKSLGFCCKNDANQAVPLEGKRIAAFCGIGNPARFFEELEASGAHLEAFIALKDHEDFASSGLHEWMNQLSFDRIDYLVCTEKDFVKIPESFKVPIPILWARKTIDISSESQAKWEIVAHRLA